MNEELSSHRDETGLFTYWNSLQPERCSKCECSHLMFSNKGDPIWECELSECYQEEKIDV